MSSIINLNKYTLLEASNIEKIYFYPEYAISNTTIKRKQEKLCVIFEIEEEKYTPLYKMNTYLINDGKKIFESYTIYLKKIDPYKYVVVNNKKDYLHAEILPKEIIDFNNLEYNSFVEIIKDNKELSKMIPDLTNAIKSNMIELQKEKLVATKIDIPSPTNYYQNITGYEVDFLENQITSEGELDISKTILKNIKKNFEVILYDKYQMNIALIALYSLILNKVKSITLKPKKILDSKELKLDTNKVSLEYNDLKEIINSIINNLKESVIENFERNIIQERIEYIINSKPNIKEFKNFIKVILVEDQYLDQTKRNRIIDEYYLKELILNSISNQNYRPLPRNQILIYNKQENNIINFICIISTDKLYTILKSYKLNSIEENRKDILLLKSLSNIIEEKKKIKLINRIEISILLILMMNIYYYKNVNSNVLLFNKGKYILKLNYIHGRPNIFVINRTTEEKYGRFIKLTEETTKLIESTLDKSEKSFIALMNAIAYQNIEECLKNINIHITCENISNKDIKIKFKRTLKKNLLELNMPAYVFLELFTSIKINNQAKIDVKEENNNKEEQNKYELYNEEYEYIIRKANTITNIMKNTPLDNPIYKKIAELYESLLNCENQNKEKIILELKELTEK